MLGIALAAESVSFARAFQQARAGARESGLPLLEFVRTSKEPASKTVFGEDAAAVLGVLVAFVGTALAQLTGERFWDAASAVVIGLLLCGVGIALGQNAKDLLIGAPARPDERERLRQVLVGHDGVDDVVELLTMYTGPHSLLVAARIDLHDGLAGDEIEELSDGLETRLREELPDVSEVFLDATSHGERRVRKEASVE